MSIMKEIAHALGVNLNEEFKIKQDPVISNRHYMFTEKGLLKSDDEGETWDDESYFKFYSLCVNDWEGEKVPPKPKKEPLLKEYKYISNILEGYIRLKNDTPSEKVHNEAQYMINAVEARKTVLKAMLQEKGFEIT